jgi:hypothetical protein
MTYPPSLNLTRRVALSTLAVTSFAVLCGCVTINIYFPAAAAEKAAEKIVDEVWNLPKAADKK